MICLVLLSVTVNRDVSKTEMYFHFLASNIFVPAYADLFIELKLHSSFSNRVQLSINKLLMKKHRLIICM